MKTTLTLKKALLIGSAIVALGASTAFAATSNTPMNNKDNSDSCNQKNMQHGPKALYRDSKVSPVDTLAKILGDDPKIIRDDAHKDFSDVYQYAQKKGVLSKYKAARLVLAKDNVQKAVDDKKITKEEGNKVLTKVQYNINHEKPEYMGIMDGHGPKRHGEKGKHMQNQQPNGERPMMDQGSEANQ